MSAPDAPAPPAPAPVTPVPVRRQVPRYAVWVLTPLCVALVGVLPLFFDKGAYVIYYFASLLLYGLVALGLQHMVGDAGVLSLGHAAFWGLGAYAGAYSTQEWEWTTLPAAGFGIVVALLGAVVMLPLLRLRGVYFVAATFAFGLTLFEVFKLAESITGGDSGRFGIPAPEVFGEIFDNNRDYYYLALVAALLAYGGLALLARSGYGLTLNVVRQSELAARASGVNVARIQAIAVAIGAAIAALGGTLYAQVSLTITPVTFSPTYSVTFIAIVIIGGLRSRWGAFVGAAFALYLQIYLRSFEEYQVLLYGAIIGTFMVVLPGGVASVPREARRWWNLLVAWRARPASRPASVATSTPAAAGASDVLLRVDGLVTGYGRLEALHGVSFELREGEMLAILGANGAGKTTTMKAIVGLLPTWSGTITLGDQVITGRSAHTIARRGLALVPEGRHLFPELSVGDNLVIAATGGKEVITANVTRMLELFPPLVPLMGRPGGTLSGGEQQMLAVARALMSNPRVLLLDEPSLGLGPLVVERLFETITEIRKLGVAIVMVEQNANLALEVSDRGVVLQQGRIVTEGSSKQLAEDPLVRRAYLGG